MRLKHHTAVSYIALFVALGGTSYAAVKLPANSVGSSQIKDRSVHVRDLDRHARPITKAKVAQAVTDVLTDPTSGVHVTVSGEKGDKGDKGDPGAPGIVSVTVRDVTAPLAQNTDGGATVRCDPGEHVLSGGGRLEGSAGYQTSSVPLNDSDQGWTVTFTNAGSSEGTVHAFAVCAVLA